MNERARSIQALLPAPDLQAVDPPVGIGKRARLPSNIIDARGCHIRAACILPDIPCPVSTERDIKDNLMVVEKVVDIASSREGTRRRAPVPRLRVPRQRICGDLVAREEPDFDEVCVPLHCVDTAAAVVVVEAVAVGVGSVVDDRAALVAGLPGGVDVAVGGQHAARGALPVDAAPGFGVEGHVVLHVLVHTLDDVDFAVVGPVVTESPAVVGGW